VVDRGPVLTVKLGTTEEARRKVDSGRLLVLVDTKAQGKVEQLGVGNTNGASKLRHGSTSTSGSTGGLTGGHTNDKVKGHNKVRDKRRKNVGDVQVKVNDERNTLTTRQLRHILATNGHQGVGRRVGETITISITTDTEAINTNVQLILNIVVLKEDTLDIPTRDGQHNVTNALVKGKRGVRSTLAKLSGNTNIGKHKRISGRVIDALSGDGIGDEEDTKVAGTAGGGVKGRIREISSSVTSKDRSRIRLRCKEEGKKSSLHFF